MFTIERFKKNKGATLQVTSSFPYEILPPPLSENSRMSTGPFDAVQRCVMTIDDPIHTDDIEPLL